LYHKPVISEKPGDIEASAAPRKARTTIKPIKLEVVAWQVRMMAHTTLEKVGMSARTTMKNYSKSDHTPGSTEIFSQR